jgi:hypothetical protein
MRDFIMSLPEDSNYLYVLTSTFDRVMQMREEIKRLRGSDFCSKVLVIDLLSMNRIRAGADLLKVYVEEAAYDYATAKQLTAIYSLEEARDAILHGDTV